MRFVILGLLLLSCVKEKYSQIDDCSLACDNLRALQCLENKYYNDCEEYCGLARELGFELECIANARNCNEGWNCK